MLPVSVSRINTNVKIAWVPSDSNASEITSFKIMLMTSNPLVFLENLDHCDGTDLLMIANNYCLIPMQNFIDAPYNLV